MTPNYTPPPAKERTAKPKPSKLDRVLARRADDREEEKAWDACCRAVDARDKKRCRCCGRKAKPDATTLLERMHRHHLQYRSKEPALINEPSNVCSLCAWCHGAEHAGQLAIVGADANQRLEFEVEEAVIVAIFGTRQVPGHVRIVVPGGERQVS